MTVSVRHVTEYKVVSPNPILSALSFLAGTIFFIQNQWNPTDSRSEGSCQSDVWRSNKLMRNVPFNSALLCTHTQTCTHTHSGTAVRDLVVNDELALKALIYH